MKLHFLVEGPADAAFLERLLPRLIPRHRWQVYPHEGRGRLPGKLVAPPDAKRRGLLDNLPAKLSAWGKTFDPATDRVVVVLDQDIDDCKELLAKLGRMYAHLSSRPQAIFRLAIEETESWYLGDAKAVQRAFPKADGRKLATWRPDSVDRTWEKFQEIIRAAADDKVAWGEAMGQVLAVDEPLDRKNRSPSFRKFCRRVREHAGEPVRTARHQGGSRRSR